MDWEKDVAALAEKLRAVAGPELKSVVLYGSAASGHFQPGHSDLNVLCVIAQREATLIDRLSGPAKWWMRKGLPAPLIFTQEELRRSADVFAIELLDIKANHRVLWGEDVFRDLEVPMRLHRVQVEHELRSKLVRLRQRYLAAAGDRGQMLELMSASLSSLLTLFRHALLSLGQPVPEGRRAVVEQLAALLGVEANSFCASLDLREGRLRAREADVLALARSYLETVARVTDEVDRRLESPPQESKR